jgi:hypothetical protein
VTTMNTKSKDERPDELRSEYSDLGEIMKDGVQGKYAARYREGTNLVLLAPDVAEAFPTDESVNEALRLVIQLRQIPSAGARTATKP